MIFCTRTGAIAGTLSSSGTLYSSCFSFLFSLAFLSTSFTEICSKCVFRIVFNDSSPGIRRVASFGGKLCSVLANGELIYLRYPHD